MTSVVASHDGFQVLRCAHEGHYWAREARGGRAPKYCRQHAGRLRRPASDNAARQRAITLASAGLSLRQIGAACGVSGECVRLWLNEAGFTSAMRREAKSRMKQSVVEELLRERIADALPCVVCGRPVLRANRPGSRVTCSRECAKAWPELRVHTPEGRERHRRSIAKSILRHPEGKHRSQIEWAQRYLAGDAAPPRSSWYVKGSRAHEAAKQFGWAR